MSSAVEEGRARGLSRRALLAGAAGAAGAALGACATASEAGGVILPSRVETAGGIFECFDTGGAGAAVVLLHPASGDARVWKFQMGPLRAAGYRAVAYSRGGYGETVTGPVASATGDLFALADALRIDSFHLVGLAAGGYIAPPAALERPARLKSIVIASSLIGLAEQDYLADTERLMPAALRGLPPALRELGPDYRWRDPAGLAEWNAIAARYETTRSPPSASLRAADFARLSLPVMLMTGASDLYVPPARMAATAHRLGVAKTAVIEGAAHAPQWENPDAFNKALIGFLNSARR